MTVLFYIIYELVGVHNQLHTYPMIGFSLFQSFVKDADTKRGGGSAAMLLTAEGNHSRLSTYILKFARYKKMKIPVDN